MPLIDAYRFAQASQRPATRGRITPFDLRAVRALIHHPNEYVSHQDCLAFDRNFQHLPSAKQTSACVFTLSAALWHVCDALADNTQGKLAASLAGRYLLMQKIRGYAEHRRPQVPVEEDEQEVFYSGAMQAGKTHSYQQSITGPMQYTSTSAYSSYVRQVSITPPSTRVPLHHRDAMETLAHHIHNGHLMAEFDQYMHRFMEDS